jgi:hypothetical protein
MTERKKRGRPRLPSWDEIVGELLTPEDAARADAMKWLWVTQNRRGGRPPDRAVNQWLSEVVKDADRRGRKLRPYLKEALERKLNRTVELGEVARCERQIDRLGLRPKGAPKSRSRRAANKKSSQQSTEPATNITPTLKNGFCPKTE